MAEVPVRDVKAAVGFGIRAGDSFPIPISLWSWVSSGQRQQRRSQVSVTVSVGSATCSTSFTPLRSADSQETAVQSGRAVRLTEFARLTGVKQANALPVFDH